MNFLANPIHENDMALECWVEMRLAIQVCVVSQLCLTLCDPMDCSPPGSSVHANSPGKNTGVSCHALLQGIFPIQESRLVCKCAKEFEKKRLIVHLL